jgi:hypothetical protein
MHLWATGEIDFLYNDTARLSERHSPNFIGVQFLDGLMRPPYSDLADFGPTATSAYRLAKCERARRARRALPRTPRVLLTGVLAAVHCVTHAQFSRGATYSRSASGISAAR